MADKSFFFDQICDDLNVVGSPGIYDESLVMSLLEDSSGQVEDGDAEMLRTVIQSLEQEIDKNSDEYPEDYHRFSDAELVGINSSTSSIYHRLEFDWIDTEMDNCSSPIDNMTSYFIGDFMDTAENMDGCGVLGDYAQFCYEMSMEEEEDYGSLWQ